MKITNRIFNKKLNRKLHKGIGIYMVFAMFIVSLPCSSAQSASKTDSSLNTSKLYEGAINLRESSTEASVSSDDTTGTYADENGLEFTYTIISDTEVEITEYTGKLTEIEIPAYVQKDKVYSVRGIGEKAFYNSIVKSVIIPNGVTYISNYAFEYSSLRTIEFPESLVSIGGGAFLSCRYLKNPLNLPDGIEVIGINAFRDCRNITAPMSLPSSLCSIGNYAFYGCDGNEKIVIGDKLETIGYDFVPKDELKEVIVSENNKKYDSRDNCNGIIEKASLKLVFGCNITDIPKETISIGKASFYNTDITKVTMPDSVRIVEDNAFQSCNSLKTINFSDNLIYIGKNSFYECDSLEKLTIPGNVRVIDAEAFSNCYSLTTLVIEEGVISIGGCYSGSFQGCSMLTKITLPESLKNIPDEEFIATMQSGFGVKVFLPSDSYADYIMMRNKERYKDDINLTIAYNGEAQNPIEEENEDIYSYPSGYYNYYKSTIDVDRFCDFDYGNLKSYSKSFYNNNYTIQIEDENVAKYQYINGTFILTPKSEGITVAYIDTNNGIGTKTAIVIRVYDNDKDTDGIAISNVVEKIESLDRELSYPDDYETVKDVVSAYEDLTNIQKNKMEDSYKQMLEAADDEIENKKAEYDNNIETANSIKMMIEDIANTEIEYTEECNKKISEVETKYSNMEDSFKYLVDNYSKLTSARIKYNELKNADDKEKANEVVGLIHGLSSWDGTLKNGNQIKDVRAAYESLTSDQKSFVSYMDLQILEDYEKKLALLEKAASYTEQPVETEKPTIIETEKPIESKVPETVAPVLETESPVDETVNPTDSKENTENTEQQSVLNNLSTLPPQDNNSQSENNSSSKASATATPNTTANTNNTSVLSDTVDCNFEIAVKSIIVKKRAYVFSGEFGKARQIMFIKAVNVKWAYQKNVSLYRVYRSSTPNGEYRVIGETTKNIFLDKKVDYGKKYFYRVQCVKDDTTYSSGYKKSAVSMSLIKPIISIKNEAGKFIMINYRKSEGEYQEVQVLVNNKWIRANTMCGKISPDKVSRPLNQTKFYLRVRTYTKYNGKKIYSKWSNRVYVK
ncbi:MAG: leucine-rich repeat protein [Lachnospiraceae bacterium]|nr:leucine-rich repeat protein [Lachnospiraceae bacterium]